MCRNQCTVKKSYNCDINLRSNEHYSDNLKYLKVSICCEIEYSAVDSVHWRHM